MESWTEELENKLIDSRVSVFTILDERHTVTAAELVL